MACYVMKQIFAFFNAFEVLCYLFFFCDPIVLHLFELTVGSNNPLMSKWVQVVLSEYLFLIQCFKLFPFLNPFK